jgi:hypothetical protein
MRALQAKHYNVRIISPLPLTRLVGSWYNHAFCPDWRALDADVVMSPSRAFKSKKNTVSQPKSTNTVTQNTVFNTANLSTNTAKSVC